MPLAAHAAEAAQWDRQHPVGVHDPTTACAFGKAGKPSGSLDAIGQL